MSEPITVAPGTLPGMVTTALRYIIAAIGGWIVAKGYLTVDQWTQVGGALIALAPLVWGVVSSFRNKKKLIAVAEAAPNSVAVVSK